MTAHVDVPQSTARVVYNEQQPQKQEQEKPIKFSNLPYVYFTFVFSLCLVGLGYFIEAQSHTRRALFSGVHVVQFMGFNFDNSSPVDGPKHSILRKGKFAFLYWADGAQYMNNALKELLGNEEFQKDLWAQREALLNAILTGIITSADWAAMIEGINEFVHKWAGTIDLSGLTKKTLKLVNEKVELMETNWSLDDIKSELRGCIVPFYTLYGPTGEDITPKRDNFFMDDYLTLIQKELTELKLLTINA